MTATRSGPGDFAAALGEHARRLAGMARRFVVTLSTKAIWQLKGHTLPNGVIETRQAEVFSGIGFYSRPADGGKPEAFAIFTGDGGGNPVVVATRDEATRAASVGDLAAGETAIYTDKAVVIVKADGSIEARSVGGVAVELATKADLAKLESAILGATVVGGDGGASLRTTMSAGLPTSLHGAGGTTPWPAGTSKFKAE
jgi:phage gp45-like